MSRLDEIKNEYAKSQGFENWKELWFDTTNFKHADQRYNEVMKVYATECVKASLVKACENGEVDYDQKFDLHSVNYNSITNPENIILL